MLVSFKPHRRTQLRQHVFRCNISSRSHHDKELVEHADHMKEYLQSHLILFYVW